MKPTSEKAKSASKVSSRSHLGERVPQLRFPGFIGEWACLKLNDFAERVTRKNGSTSDIPLTISAQHGLIDQRTFFSKAVASADMSGYYLLKNGEFAYNRSSSGEFPFGSIKRLDQYKAGAVSTLYICFGLRDQSPVSDFVKWYFDSSKWHREAGLICAEGARNHGLLNVPTAGFFNTIHHIPANKDEQKKIASFLSLVDRRLTAQRRLVELLKKHKRGLSNGLFSGKVRMVRNAKWKTYRLGDIVRRVTRKNGKASDVPLTISAQYGLIDQREFFSKAVASADMSGYCLLKQGEFAYNRSSSGEYPFGSIKRLERYNQGAVSTLYICFEVLGDKDDAEFLKWYFDSFAWHREVGMICAEGERNHGLLNVPTDGFFDTKHILPSDKDERKNIAALMALADARCERAETELTRLTALKSGLLQQLFA